MRLRMGLSRSIGEQRRMAGATHNAKFLCKYVARSSERDHSRTTLANGGIEQTNFDNYTPLRMSQMPEVAVAVIANGEHASGVGEPAVTVIAPALGHAVFNACGARVRALPITAEA